MVSQILTDPKIKPESHVLENVLGKHYKKFTEFVNKIKDKNLVLEWNYYNDGKSWLGKVLNKKKNLCWLSVWDTGFKLTFYFTEKNISGIYELEIDDEIKDMVKNTKAIGKLLPIMILIKNTKRINDGIKILEYKMQLK